MKSPSQPFLGRHGTRGESCVTPQERLRRRLNEWLSFGQILLYGRLLWKRLNCMLFSLCPGNTICETQKRKTFTLKEEHQSGAITAEI